MANANASTNAEPEGERIRLMLSGGGNRAMVGSIGAIAYLVEHKWWESVDEVVSVSGGSATNAALLTGGGDSDEETLDALAHFFENASTDIGQPWKAPKRLTAIGMILATVCIEDAGVIIYR